MNNLPISATDAPKHVLNILQANLVPMIWSSPGMGKSSVALKIAKDNNLKFIDVRLSSYDPVDLNGYPIFAGEEGQKKASYIPFDTFPTEHDKVPDGYNGWLILLDELTSAVPAVQAPAYRLILDRQVGNHNLHKNVAMMAAGNLTTDNAISYDMSTALQSRMVHLQLKTEPKGWTQWAEDASLDHRVLSFIRFKEENLNTFNPDHSDFTFACERTWEMASKIISNVRDINYDILPVLAGTVGEGVAREFVAYIKVYATLPTLSAIEHNPGTIDVPAEAGTKHAVAGLISSNITEDNIDNLLIYILRLPIEFQVICLRSAIRKNSKLIHSSAVSKWSIENAALLTG